MEWQNKIMWKFAFVLALPLAAQEVKIEKNIVYIGDGRQELMDVYQPAARSAKGYPAILVIHGGGWVGGKRDAQREQQMGDVFAKAGFVAASIDYKLSVGETPSWPQNLYDCKTAVRFLRKNAARFNINPAHIGVIGGSAGGHLSMMVAYTGGNPKLDPPGPYGEYSTKVRAVVDLYGVPLMDERHTGKNMLKGLANAETYRVASPATYVTAGSPPLLMMHGTADKTVPIAWSDEFETVLKERKANYIYKRVEGAPHTFLINSKYGDFRVLITGFFHQHLGQ
jgi:acetyl esterase/lipase